MPATAADFFNHQDPVLQAVFHYKPADSLEDQLNRAYQSNGFNGLIQARLFQAQAVNRYRFTAPLMCEAGDWLAQNQMPTEAKRTYEEILQHYPKYAAAHTGLAKVLADEGNPIRRAHGAKSLGLRPNHSPTLALFKRLKAEK